MKPSRFCYPLLVLALVLAHSRESLANGRFPRADRLIEDPRDPNHLLLSATYGLLVTETGGATWQHVCEAAFTNPDNESDVVAALSSAGDVLLSSVDSFSRSPGNLCQFDATLGQAEEQGVPDFTLDSRGTVIALRASNTGGHQTNELLESSDQGRHFRPMGEPLPESVFYVTTVDAAPSDTDRIYVSGLGLDGSPLLLRSRDRAQSFETLPLPIDGTVREVPYIAAVHPQDADVLYIRTDIWRDADDGGGVEVADDALFVTKDGGDTFTEVLRASGKLFGFALSPDGQDLLVGYGDPIAGLGRTTKEDALGLYHARVDTLAFEQLFTGSITCLTWSSSGIYACASEAQMGFTLGLLQPADIAAGSTPWTPLMSLRGPISPLKQSNCSSSARCSADWSYTCNAWGRTDCATNPTTESEGPSAATSEGKAAGCSYRTLGSERATGAALLLALLVLLGRRRC
jgi:hypothetical protein